MKGMNFEEWQALMRTQRNGGTSSEIHNHEAVISNKNPNSESGNAAADEFRAKQRYHNEQSKGMATDRKSLDPLPEGKVGFSNILTTMYMAAIQDGKIIVRKDGEATLYYYATQENVDEFIAADKTFGELLDSDVLAEGNLSRLRHDDDTVIADSDQLAVGLVNRSSGI